MVVQFEVIGEERIHCAGCESRIATALTPFARCRGGTGKCRDAAGKLTIDPARVSADEVRARLEQLGYQVHK